MYMSRKSTVYTPENDQIKYFFQSYLVKMTFPYVQTTSWICCYCHKLRFFKFEESFKDFFRELQVLDMYCTLNNHQIILNTFPKHKKTGTL